MTVLKKVVRRWSLELGWWKMSLPVAGGWNWMSFKILLAQTMIQVGNKLLISDGWKTSGSSWIKMDSPEC